MSRIFKVWVNLDDLAATLVHWETDQERSAWLAGFHAGAYGSQARTDWSKAKLSGFEFGQSCHQEALGYSQKQRDRANGRWQKDAAAMPRHSRGNAPAEPGESHGNANPTSNIQHPTESREQPVGKTPSLLKNLLLRTTEETVGEWRALALGDARCKNEDEINRFIEWAVEKARKDGRMVAYARECMPEAYQWAQRKKANAS